MQYSPKDTARFARTPECVQCGELLFLPEWSEYVDEFRVRHLWQCEACSYSFETTVSFAVEAEAA